MSGRKTSGPQRDFTPMTVAGIMSGTSADGVDVALVRISPGAGGVRLRLIAHEEFPFAPALRRAVLGAMNASATSTAELARLNWRLGQAYAEALAATMKKHPTRLQLVGCHGQTVYHQPEAKMYAGRRVACTWQIGEMAVVAAGGGVPVVSNFRPADMVAGGQGAPLVPLLDRVLFQDAKRGRVLQNIGGIGNLTALPPGAEATDTFAFDTGPGNMVIDQLMHRLFAKDMDRNGTTAARGRVLEPVVAQALGARFFQQRPPKSAGREQFGAEFANAFLAACYNAQGTPEDAVASATALTAGSIQVAYERFVQRRMKEAPVDFVISGGGSRNATLLGMLARRLEPLGCKVRVSDELGLPAQAKEAAAFALLAYYTWHGRAGNVPSATGANRPAMLGSITYA